jgi:hypothetical protein
MAAAADKQGSGGSAKREKTIPRVTSEVAQIVENVRDFFEQEAKLRSTIHRSRVVERLVDATQLSRATIEKIHSQQPESFPGTLEPREHPHSSMITREMEGEIRAMVAKLYSEGNKVTLAVLLSALKERDRPSTRLQPALDFDVSVTTLWRALQRMGFRCREGANPYNRIHEKSSILRQRVHYIREVQRLREDGFTLFYQDETWFNKNMVPDRQWLDEQGRGGREAPIGKGQRLIVAHVGSDSTGFLPECLYCVSVDYNKATDDPHRSMNSEVYLGWLKNVVLPGIRSSGLKGALIVDRATYHRSITAGTKPSWKYMNKQDIIGWLIDNGGDSLHLPPYEKMTVVELRELCSIVAPEVKYEVVELAATFGIPVVYLPVAHPELNPIEKMWAITKAQVLSVHGVSQGEEHRSYTMSELEEHVRSGISKVKVSMWRGVTKRVLEIEEEYMKLADEDDYGYEGEEEEEENVDGL